MGLIISSTIPRFKSLPFWQIVSVSEFRKGPIERRKVLIEGLLKKKDKLVVSGPSKIGKTRILLDLAIAAVHNGKWFERFQCHKSSVLYVGLELHDDDLDDRFEILASGMGRGIEGIDLLQLRGQATAIEAMTELVTEKIEERKSGYDLLILDPIYKTLGDYDENKTGDVNKLMEGLEKIAQANNTSVVFAHHFSKGNKSDVQSGDRSSGSGVFLREPDASIELVPKDPSKPDSRIDVHIKLRGFASIEVGVCGGTGLPHRS